MSVLFLFGLAVIGLAAQPGDGSTPYKNDYYVACTGYKPNCVQDKCVMFGPRTTLCTECLSGKVPINGACVGKDDSPADPSIDPTVCVTESITGSDASQRCTSCTGGTKASEAGGSTYFLFYGGCYNKMSGQVRTSVRLFQMVFAILVRLRTVLFCKRQEFSGEMYSVRGHCWFQ